MLSLLCETATGWGAEMMMMLGPRGAMLLKSEVLQSRLVHFNTHPDLDGTQLPTLFIDPSGSTHMIEPQRGLEVNRWGSHHGIWVEVMMSHKLVNQVKEMRRYFKAYVKSESRKREGAASAIQRSWKAHVSRKIAGVKKRQNGTSSLGGGKGAAVGAAAAGGCVDHAGLSALRAELEEVRAELKAERGR